MESYQMHVLQSHRRVLHWCEANPDVVPRPDGPRASWLPITRHCEDLRLHIDAVEAAATEQGVQTAAASPEATGEPALRDALCAEMRLITQIAQTLKTSVPGIGQLKMPADRIENERLVHFAATLLARATTYAGILNKYVPTDSIDQMNAAISALRTSIDSRGIALAKRVAATKDIAVSLEKAKQDVMSLDAGVCKRLYADLPRLAGWKNAKRITKRGATGPRSSHDPS